jgi:hypothetical protein
LKEEVESLFDKKWKLFLKKETRGSFKLSNKQLPTGAISTIQQKIEDRMRNSEIENMSAQDIPKSRMWVHRKIQTLKQHGEINIDGMV